MITKRIIGINIILLLSFGFLSASREESFDTERCIYNYTIKSFVNLFNQNGQNTVMSPLSTQVLLTVAYAGSTGQTAIDLASGLGLTGQTSGDASDDFNVVMTYLQKLDKYTQLALANKIYLNESLQFVPSFAADAAKCYTEIQSIDFTSQYNGVDAINGWASLKTNSSLSYIIYDDDITPQTELMLLNAVALTGTWKTKFNQGSTSPSTFYTTATNSEQMPMMFVWSDFPYGRANNLAAKIIQLPYTNYGLSMLIILPDDRNGLTTLVNNLQRSDIYDILKDLTSEKVGVQIPKFTIETYFRLNDVLTKMGMGIIFTKQADFSKMVVSDMSISQNTDLTVSSVIQKAYIAVSEDGVNNAAPLDATETSEAFIADHPFVFMIIQYYDVLMIGSFVGGPSAIVSSTSSTPSTTAPSVTSQKSTPAAGSKKSTAAANSATAPDNSNGKSTPSVSSIKSTKPTDSTVSAPTVSSIKSTAPTSSTKSSSPVNNSKSTSASSSSQASSTSTANSNTPSSSSSQAGNSKSAGTTSSSKSASTAGNSKSATTASSNK